mgnify:CR=1 FL=1
MATVRTSAFRRMGLCVAVFVALTLLVSGSALAAVQDPFTGNPVAKIARDHSNAVVNIDVEGTVQQSSPFADDPIFRHFFGDQFRDFSRSVPMKGRGSGFLVSKDGHILTNNHVVEKADKITVTFSNGETRDAKVLGKDPTFDLAVLKIEGNNYPFLELGDSDKTEVGEWVVAIGNPYGLEHSVTVGVISAKNRSVHASDVNFDGFLQTDAAINPGNSGGPLIDLQGQAVGINTAIIPFAQGIGFAVPINMAKQIMDDLIKFGEVKRGWLGVYIQPLTKDFAEAYGVKEETGTIVGDVVQDSPADKAGIRRGDVLLSVNGEKVKNPQEFVAKVRQKLAGDKVTIELVRQRRTQTVDVVLSEVPGSEGSVRAAGTGGSQALKSLGIEVGPVTEQMQRELKLKNRDGVAVLSVENGSMAQRAGIRTNDILLEVNGERVTGAQSLDKIATKKGSSTVLLIWRDGRTFFVSIRPEN